MAPSHPTADSSAGPLILSINAGSSSVKITVYSLPQKSHPSYPSPTALATAEISGITAPPASFKYTVGGTTRIKGQELPKDKVHDQASAFSYILSHLTSDANLPQVSHKDDIKYACHRIVHGGAYRHMEELNADTLHKLEALSDLAPLHNVVGLQIVRAAHDELPAARNFACFDSAFHQSIPEHIYTYPIPQETAKKNGLRKYGFHGISYAFITRSVAEFLGKSQDDTNIIALHLGSGASACAIVNGKSRDTSMGLTPLAGLPGGSRSGDLDPSLVFHYTHDAGKLSPSSTKDMHITTAEELLNKKSGFKALAGTSDFGEITKKAAEGDAECKLAFDLFTDRVLNFVGSYYVKLGGKVDALVFAGGIGERGVDFRERIVQHCVCLGFEIDQEKNKKSASDVVADIGSKTSRHRVLVCQTDEQFEMARGCVIATEQSSQS